MNKLKIIFFFFFVKIISLFGFNWIKNDFPKAIQLAKEKERPILIDFFSKNCHYCFVLDKEVFRSKEFQKWEEKFILLRIEGDNFPEIVEKFQILGYPTVIFLDFNGVEIGRVDGYLPKSDFLDKISLYYKNKDLLKTLEDKIKKEPGNYYHYFQLALYYDKAKDLKKSEYFLSKALLFLDSSNSNYFYNKKNLLYNLSVQNMKLENYQKAYSYWNALINWLKPDDYDLPYARFYRAYSILQFTKNLSQKEKAKLIEDLQFAYKNLPDVNEKNQAKKMLFELSK